MNSLQREREVNWGLVRILYNDIAKELTLKQYNKWTTDSNGQAGDGSYWYRFNRLAKVTKNKKLLKKAKAAMYEITGISE
jgi:hypothetical protein